MITCSGASAERLKHLDLARRNRTCLCLGPGRFVSPPRKVPLLHIRRYKQLLSLSSEARMNQATRRVASHILRRPRNTVLPRCPGRWNSTFEQREWSTPLAKTLANVMKVVMHFTLPLTALLLIIDFWRLGHRSRTNRGVHAPGFDFP